MADHDYRLFGLRVRSDIVLPELNASASTTEPEVAISSGEVPRGLPESPGVHRHRDGVLLSIEGVARYWVAGGTRIVVAADPGVPIANVRLYLLGSAMGMLLHQRGLLPLHANAVEIDGKVYAFMGHSGAGKSTLAAWFHDHGFRVISDDVCVVRFNGRGLPTLSEGIPRLRLSSEALKASGRSMTAFERSYVGDESYDKFDVPLARATTSGGPRELAAVYLLERGKEFRVEQLEPVSSIDAVYANTFRGGYIGSTSNSEIHWQNCLRLVRSTPIFRLFRPWSLTRYDEIGEAILSNARSVGAAS